MTGANGVTVTTAAWLVTEPAGLVNTARNRRPESATVNGPTVKVAPVAPSTGVHVVPSVEDSHRTEGAGSPDAPAVNDADWPEPTVVSDGSAVTTGANGVTVT